MFKYLNKLPSWVLYIGFILLLILVVYCFPRVVTVLGLVYQYGLYAFFGVMIIIAIGYLLFTKKK